MALELPRRPQELRHSGGEGKAPPVEIVLGTGLAVVLHQLGLVIKEIEMRRRARHMEEDDVLYRGGKMRVPRNHRPAISARRGAAILCREGGQGHRAEAHGAVADKVTTGLGESIAPGLRAGKWINHGLAIVSSRFRRTLPTTDQAARSASSTPSGARPR